jgi:hypothetical protein
LKELKSVLLFHLEQVPQPSSCWMCRTCKMSVYWSKSPEAGWTGGKGRWHCPKCSLSKQSWSQPLISGTAGGFAPGAAGGSWTTPPTSGTAGGFAPGAEGGSWTTPPTSGTAEGSAPEAAGGSWTTPPTSGTASDSASGSTDWAAPPKQPIALSAIQLLTLVGLPPDTTYAAVRIAHRRWLLENHPDKGGNTSSFSSLQCSWAELVAMCR